MATGGRRAGSGRPRQPTALKLLRGNPGRGPVNVHEPKYSPIEAVPPEWLDPEARAEWARLAPIVGESGHVTTADRVGFIAYVRAWSRWVAADREATAALAATEDTAETRARVTATTYRADKAFDRLLRAAAEMGLTPASRSRVVAKPVGAPGSKWAGAIP
jgi:P27 family predicted phage terminase small subunit